MTLKQNMKRLGLVYDINADIRPYKKDEKMVCEKKKLLSLCTNYQHGVI